METDKFERHIKDQLNDRKINPSEHAWAKISSELNTTTKKKPVFVWIGVAASVVVLVGLATFIFNTNTELKELPLEVVEQNNDIPEKEREVIKPVPFQEKMQEVIVDADRVKGKYKEAATVAVNTQKSISMKEKVAVKDEIEVAVVEKVPTKETPDKTKFSDAIINSKISEIVARVDDLERFNALTDAEVDSLLRRAQDEILRDKIFNTDKSVDAMALLTEVEDELDQSFRDQIFSSLKAGFLKVRTAVADRNN